jgi:MFS family permease
MKDTGPKMTKPKRGVLPRQVKNLGLVSFFNDTASEMIFPLLPAFVTGVLGLGPHVLGIMEGVAESVASLVKYFSGWLSDRTKKRKPLTVAGYTLSSILRPFMGLAGTAWQVVSLRAFDRIGKGVRTSPRDALLAASVGPDLRGMAFGFHRAMDHAGAVAGPLIALVLLYWVQLDLRTLFILTVIPGFITVLLIIFSVREQTAADQYNSHSVSDTDPAKIDTPGKNRRDFGMFLTAMVLFTLGNSSDFFLVLHAHELGVPVALAPVLWIVLHLSKGLFATPGGALSDRIGRKSAILLGWGVYSLTYLGFAIADKSWHIWPLFVFYGVFYGLTEAPEKALTADIVPQHLRGKGFGLYHMSVGIAALPASVVAGYLWENFGAAVALGLGSFFAALAALVLALALRSGRYTAR